jgi:hypothetical protein
VADEIDAVLTRIHCVRGRGFLLTHFHSGRSTDNSIVARVAIARPTRISAARSARITVPRTTS